MGATDYCCGTVAVMFVGGLLFLILGSLISLLPLPPDWLPYILGGVLIVILILCLVLILGSGAAFLLGDKINPENKDKDNDRL